MRIKQKVKWGEQAEKQQGELADAVRQLTSMLDGLEIHEARSNIERSRSAQCCSPMPEQRITKLSMKSGVTKNDWRPMPTTPAIPNPDTTSPEETAGGTKYMVYQITDDATTPPTAGWDWVRAHA